MKISHLRLLALVSLLALPLPGAAQQRPELSLITVSGQAEINVPPDEAVFSLQVTKMDKDLSAAQRAGDDTTRQLIAIARRFDVAQQDVKTDYISVEMKYSTDLVEEEDEDTKKVRREFLGYEVSKTVFIRLKDLARFEQFFSEVLKSGVTRVSNVSFQTSRLRQYKDQARAAAMRAAREKAVALAREIGQTIGRAHSIEEEDTARSASSNNYSTAAFSRYSSEEGSAFSPGTISVTAQVTVKFIIN